MSAVSEHPSVVLQPPAAGAVAPARGCAPDACDEMVCACGQRHTPTRADRPAKVAVGMTRLPTSLDDIPPNVRWDGPSTPSAWALDFSPESLQAVPLDLGDLPAETSRRASRRARRKLWELQQQHHCPVIGTCLGVAELRRIAARLSPPPREPVSDFEVHVSFVAAASAGRNPLSLATHKALERKFQGVVQRFERARDPEAVLGLWRECVARGKVAGGLWALMTHPLADARAQRLAFEEVHMLSHQVGAGNRADLKRLADTAAELATLRRDFDALYTRSRRQAEEREALIADLERRLGARESALAASQRRERALTEQLAAMRSRDPDAGAARIATLEAELATLGARLASAEQAGGEALGRATLAEQALAEKTAECAALERLLGADLADAPVTDPCAGCANADSCRAASDPDLAGRLILCVGGRLPQVQHLARLVADANGRFEHHDGGLEDRDRRLESQLAGADAVICATDYISHAAYYRTKRYCKRHAKPHVLVPRSGIAAFALALERVAG